MSKNQIKQPMDYKLFETGVLPSDQLGKTEEELTHILAGLAAFAQSEFDKAVVNIKTLRESDLDTINVKIINWAIENGKTPMEWVFYGAKAATACQLVADGLKKATLDAIMQDAAEAMIEKNSKKEAKPTIPGPAKGD